MLDAQEHVSVGDNVIDTGGGGVDRSCFSFSGGLTSLDFADDIISHRMSICDMMFAERLV